MMIRLISSIDFERLRERTKILKREKMFLELPLKMILVTSVEKMDTL